MPLRARHQPTPPPHPKQCLNYGYCFGVELVVDNVITYYLFDQFRLSAVVAGAMGSIFGCMNIFTRATGGMISGAWCVALSRALSRARAGTRCRAVAARGGLLPLPQPMLTRPARCTVPAAPPTPTPTPFGPHADLCAKHWGMRGRLWSLWTIQTLGGVFCLLLGVPFVYSSLAATMVVLVIFSIWCQQACGLSCGVVPFVSKRSTGLVYGMVGAGGNTGAAVTQARECRAWLCACVCGVGTQHAVMPPARRLHSRSARADAHPAARVLRPAPHYTQTVFFTFTGLAPTAGFFWMGVMVIGMTALYALVYFPMWGGMFCPAKPGVTEEDYYLSGECKHRTGPLARGHRCCSRAVCAVHAARCHWPSFLAHRPDALPAARPCCPPPPPHPTAHRVHARRARRGPSQQLAQVCVREPQRARLEHQRQERGGSGRGQGADQGGRRHHLSILCGRAAAAAVAPDVHAACVASLCAVCSSCRRPAAARTEKVATDIFIIAMPHFAHAPLRVGAWAVAAVAATAGWPCALCARLRWVPPRCWCVVRMPSNERACVCVRKGAAKLNL
jgi:hypothetical protein